MKDPVISAIIPVYEANTDHLVAAIRSIVDQSFEQWELILVEDACPSHSAAKVLREIHNHKNEIRAVRLDRNCGVAATRNIGASLARGHYVCFLDQDDALKPDFMQTTFQVLQHYPQINVIRVTPEFPIEVDPVRHDALTNSLMTTALIPKAVLKAVGGWPTDPIFYETPYAGEDICLKHCLEVAFSLKTITNPLYFHRCGHGNHTDKFLERSKVVEGQIVMTRGSEWDQKLAQHISEKCRVLTECLQNGTTPEWAAPSVGFEEISIDRSE